MDNLPLRRDMMLAALVASLPIHFAESAAAATLNPSDAIIIQPDSLPWKPGTDFSEPSVDNCVLAGQMKKTGLYFQLIRWWPGFMSAPHSYATDRLSVVVSGTWWCGSGTNFDPAACVAVPAGSFVRRVGGTPHYDGVLRGQQAPAIIAVCGMGPVKHAWSDPSKPGIVRL